MGHVEQNRGFRAAAPPSRGASPRICMPTWRNFAKRAFRCALYEAQDVLTEISDVDLIDLDMAWGAWFDERSLSRPLYHDISRKLIFANPGLKKVRLARHYDLFIVVCSWYTDLPYINAIKGWRDRCKISICWIDEMWVADITKFKYCLHALNQFDYVFVNLNGSVRALSMAAKLPCHWLPVGIDTLRFNPGPVSSAARVIDVYSIGRRYEGVHRQMLKAGQQGEIFYLYDTFAAANTDVHDYRQHRDLYANIAKRSRFFTVATAKMDVFDETQGQVEIGHRYYEGAAAGAVMLGDVPDCEAYRQLFDWPEAVVPIQPDGSDTMAVFNELRSDPGRVAAISMRNATEALLRHDWVYRWKEMFRVAGIEPTPRMAIREQRLKELAGFAAIADEKGAAARGA
jgi:hypothetical protein